MGIIKAILFGIVQGLAEFLPVSSSGHLVLLQKIFGISEMSLGLPALLFDTLLHVGTLAAVCAVLWKDIWAILRKLNQPLTVYLIVATVPTVIAALVFKKQLDAAFETGRFLGYAFLGTAALLTAAELIGKFSRKGTENLQFAAQRQRGKKDKYRESIREAAKKMTFLDSLVIGLMQAIAVIPGVSRSGATLSGALFRNLDRDFAARFSFLLSIPAILGALVFQFKGLLKSGIIDSISGLPVTAGGGMGVLAIIAGTLSAAITGFFAVRLMLKIVREKRLWGFAVYTAVLGLLILTDQFLLHRIF